MLRWVEKVGLALAVTVIASVACADERAEANALLRQALAAMSEAERAPSPAARLRALEQAAANVARLVREYGNTYIGLRLASGQPIGNLDPARLERSLAEARAQAKDVGAIGRPADEPRAPAQPRPSTGKRPCEIGVAAGRRPGEPGPSLAEVIADCRSALVFEPGAPRWRYQLARALSERGEPGDREEAIRLLEAAAADGWSLAKAELCARYLWGIGTEKNPGRARIMCEAAAAEGNEQARQLLRRPEFARATASP
ncbi:MAG: hypothetical protein N2038_01365 [Geminicoccaceae bacterium]|nr:hypothetical protein [Geminicoccaceae bacterium]MCS7266857.1 hypothetical protein [Geminicoccaceae bacterium]MCX7628879.1 hypothetical protein [Geminicoccaceae bacterium]MDW8124220.1 hypothetical protein [Geminicoccaceae bacterium]MDW8340557.1 hypothetical protein [Geminicoccaceae bacterium]